MDLGLRGLKAIVSGGTKGIGRAIVDTLAAEGAHVALCARQATEVDATLAARPRRHGCGPGPGRGRRPGPTGVGDRRRP
jgi:NAD(P)-dependent dehydrogenase (short-subunit alcohol dehydrogenase family)